MADQVMRDGDNERKSGPGGSTAAGLTNVISMETWKNRPDDVSILSVASYGQGIQMLSRREKQAVLLTFALSDDVEESRLDAILKAALGVRE